MKIIRTIFQNPDSDSDQQPQQFILVVDMESEINLTTHDIPNIIGKMEKALPGIFPDDSSPLAHNCGGGKFGVDEHTFKEEIENGTSIPHLLEHVLLHLLSRRSYSCSAFCGQRSVDIERGIDTHYYLVIDCPSKIEAVVASEIGFYLIQSWIKGETAVIDPTAIFAGIHSMIDPMLKQTAA